MTSHRLVFVFVLIAVVAINAKSLPHDLTVGSRGPGDFLLQRELVKKNSGFFQIAKLKRTFTGNNYHNITQIRLYDQNRNGNGATAVIANGGPKHNFVTINFKSKRGHSINFVVEIYGR